ncbi:hypothetical protein QE400_000042 [Xanthomonas sacchari]|uniref:MASE1 domain-containing protein n=1 Tax=Xanthomonas sacchari TaxID=56458 RepID=UPI00278B8583|nr:MASE1 domain-containing protein [Xanthomonas sacchari]MDQ1090629.1 hypothetical protein [Xanthomonas sacchari]
MIAKDIAKGSLIGAAYCVAFLTLRSWSVDQWYLPAGLRLASLLFFPLRQWPYLLAGDAAAVLSLRVPMVHSRGYSVWWAYISAFAFMPILSLITLAIRSHVSGLLAKDHWILFVAFLTALWGSIISLALNALLGGPDAPEPLMALVKYTLGDYLGMLMIVLPILIWQRRTHIHRSSEKVARDAGLSTAAVLIIFLALLFVPEVVFRQILLLLMVVPAVVITLRHGWRGAAVGVLIANAGIALSMMPRVQVVGFYSPDTYSVQLLLVVGGTCLLCMGSKLSAMYEHAVGYRQAQQQSLQLAQDSYLAAERALRNRAVEYGELQQQLKNWRRNVVSYLRTKGHHSAAMETTRKGILQAQLLDEYVASLYPLKIETHGLYHVMRSVSFSNNCNTEFLCSLKGDARHLSIGMQLTVYRCLLNVVGILPTADRHMIKARTWRAAGRQGIIVRVTADASILDAFSQNNSELLREFLSRLKTHDGDYKRRHALSISFIVSEFKPKLGSVAGGGNGPGVASIDLANANHQT